MLKLYDYLETLIEAQKKREFVFENELNFFASDILQNLNIDDKEEVNESITRVFETCNVLNISKASHFKKVYRFDGVNLISDWKISPFACYLIIINCNPKNINVAKAQLYFVANRVW